ncbi:AbrB family transcriptional regulator [Lacticaseibacillus casei]|nr:AbrB family transcriptional regulator [Lacticaseibacillus casei]
MTIKAKKVGNTMTLTVPKEFKIAEGTEFTVKQRSDGGIVYLPIHHNPFESDRIKQDLKQADVTLERDILASEWD